MIWATVSSRSCFCWLYRVSPCLASRNIRNLISVSTIWQCPGVASSLALLKKGVCYDHCVHLPKVCLPTPCFILYSKVKFPCYSRYLLTSYFCVPITFEEKEFFLLLFALESVSGLHRFPVPLTNFHFFGIRFQLLWCWMVCLGKNRDHCVIFEIAPKYCISDSFVDYEGYSISCNGFCPQ